MTRVQRVAYFPILANDDDDDDDDESTSSDESLSIEFPPPPAAFSTPAVMDNTRHFVPVKNPYLQTMTDRSDSGTGGRTLTALFSERPSSPLIFML
jgi:hypothetical protein